jgi:OPA family glycerol-3-phosphate transporter-like MFS transporter
VNPELAQKRKWLLLLLVVGYSGYYLCRSNFSVAKPFLLEAYPGQIDKVALGEIASIGTLFYAFGKFIAGSLADALSGRRMFLMGMLGAILFTVVFGFGPSFFLFAWCANRFIQSFGWGGMVKIGSRWFAGDDYGRTMAIVSLSYLFGDFVSRQLVSGMFAAGLPWQTVYEVCAAVLAVIFVPTWVFVKDSPTEYGLPEPISSDKTVFSRETPASLSPWGRLRPLLSSPTFWIVCGLSFGFTFLRETFNEWTPTYLNEAAGLTKADAGFASSLFPLFGGFSVIAAGLLSDRFRRAGSSGLILGGLIFGVIGLAALSQLKDAPSAAYLVLVAVIAFALIGPYSLLAGAISLHFGGKDAAGTACGWIDGVGYLGGILAGKWIAELATKTGWASAFATLAWVAVITAVVAMSYFLIELRSSRSHQTIA